MKQLSVDELTKNPQNFMVSATWCGPCVQLKNAHKKSDLAYINYDERFENGEFKNIGRNRNLEVDHFLNVVGIKSENLTAFPSFFEYRDGAYSRHIGPDKKQLLYPEVSEYIEFEEK